VAFAAGHWFKIDAKLEPIRTGVVRRVAAAATRRLPLGPRREGPVVALVAHDADALASVVAELRRRIPVAVTVVGRDATRLERLRAVYSAWRGEIVLAAQGPRLPVRPDATATLGPMPAETEFLDELSEIAWDALADRRLWRTRNRSGTSDTRG
jgi:hypothetical protein